MSLRNDPSVMALDRLIRSRRADGDLERDLSAPAISRVLGETVVGQSRAHAAIAATVASRLSGLGVRPTGPVASMLFAGPTGCGKTDTARRLRLAIPRGERPVIRLDMTEYSEQTGLARLVGSNRGYVGFDDRSMLLTTRVRAAPDAVVIFDEFEKAHRSVQDALLQLFEEGVMTDGGGSTARFDRTIVVLTSNLGASALARRPVGFRASQAASGGAVVEAVRAELRPELCGRLDLVCAFQPLAHATLLEIAADLLTGWAQRAAGAGWTVEIGDDVIAWLVAAAGSADGARGLHRVIDQQLAASLQMIPHGRYIAAVAESEVRWIATPTASTSEKPPTSEGAPS